jgi:AcrR family transcriptional regulator
MTEKSASTRQLLLDAAAAVFSECGYARATTKEIARAAGVAEGTIYRHFSDKRDLFTAVFTARNAASFEWLLDLPALAGTGEVRENLQRLVGMIEDVETNMAPLQAAMWSEAALAKTLLSSAAERGMPGPSLAPLLPVTQYLEAEQKLGRIRRDIDAERAAFALFSIPFASVMTMRMARAAGVTANADIMGALDVVLKGLES